MPSLHFSVRPRYYYKARKQNLELTSIVLEVKNGITIVEEGGGRA